MRRVLYLNNYMTDYIMEKRNNRSVFSQPANNKIDGIINSLKHVGCNVTIISSGLVNSKSRKIFKREVETYNDNLIIYCKIFDFPLLNTMTCIIDMFKVIKNQHKEKKIDNIIFYNYKPEVAWPAFLAKKLLHIPITLEYEDGYSNISEIKGIKSILFNVTEKIVSKHINSAILVTSLLKERFSVPTTVVRGVINDEFLEFCRTFNKKRNKKFTILYSGGLDKLRGIDVLLESLRYIKEDFNLIITGKGNLECNDKRIDFKGFVSYEEMLLLMVQADVLIQCQLVNNNFSQVSFPSKLFEYIATENYIISSKVSDVEKFAGDKIQYYENDDPKLLAKCIINTFNEWKKGNNYSQNVTKLCEANRSKVIGNRILNILEI